MKKFRLEITIVDSKNSVVDVFKDGKLVRKLTFFNKDMGTLIETLNKI